jgi:hypothetical protein
MEALMAMLVGRNTPKGRGRLCCNFRFAGRLCAQYPQQSAAMWNALDIRAGYPQGIYRSET